MRHRGFTSWGRRSLPAIILTLACIKLVCIEASRSAPDIGLCESVEDKQPVLLDCLSGSKNFCCNTDLVEISGNLTKWAKRCCSETEFVLENA